MIFTLLIQVTRRYLGNYSGVMNRMAVNSLGEKKCTEKQREKQK